MNRPVKFGISSELADTPVLLRSQKLTCNNAMSASSVLYHRHSPDKQKMF